MFLRTLRDNIVLQCLLALDTVRLDNLTRLDIFLVFDFDCLAISYKEEKMTNIMHYSLPDTEL